MANTPYYSKSIHIDGCVSEYESQRENHTCSPPSYSWVLRYPQCLSGRNSYHPWLFGNTSDILCFLIDAGAVSGFVLDPEALRLLTTGLGLSVFMRFA